jgi:magnesium chelatase subunit D
MFGVDSVALDPKLMAFQKWTKKGKGGKRSKIFNLRRGRFVKAIFPKGTGGRIAVGATLRAAAPYQIIRRRRAIGTRHEGKLVHIRKDDFRIQRLARKCGSLLIFCVDASGSMALNRMGAAKGAAMTILKEAYKSRDQICLIAFHDDTADVLVPPTRSMTLAKNRLEGMPCGGGSPLALALMTAMRTGLNAIKVKQDVGRVVLVLLTDGRANVPMYVSMGEEAPEAAIDSIKGGVSRKFLKEEVLAVAKKLGALSDFNLLCIDTEDQFVGTGIAKELTKVALGNYFHLAVTESTSVARIAQQGLEETR